MDDLGWLPGPKDDYNCTLGHHELGAPVLLRPHDDHTGIHDREAMEGNLYLILSSEQGRWHSGKASRLVAIEG